MVQRALSGIQEVNDGIPEPEAMTDASTAWQGTTASPQLPGRQKSPHELNLDGMVLRQVIWLAAVIDNKHVSLDVLIACLVVAISLYCTLVGVFCWRWAGRRGCRGQGRKGGGSVIVHGMPQRTPVEKQAKTA